MQIKSKKNLIAICFLSFFLFISNLGAEEFDITAKEIEIDKENEIIVGKGSVQVQDSEGKLIYSNKVTYEKSREFLLLEGKVKIIDNEGNILKADKATYDKINEKIVTYNNTELSLKEGYKLNTKNISYNVAKKTLKSDESSIFTDIDGNIIETTMFQYDIENNLFSSIGKIKISDIKKNKYFFKEIHIDTKKREMVGSETFGQSIHDGLANVQRRRGGGGGGVANVHDVVGVLDQEVIRETTVRGHGLSPYAGGGGLEVLGLDFGNEAPKGFHERCLVVGSPHFAESHLPVFAGHSNESGVGEGLEEVAQVEVELAVGFPAEGEHGVGPALYVTVNHAREVYAEEGELRIRHRIDQVSAKAFSLFL